MARWPAAAPGLQRARAGVDQPAPRFARAVQGQRGLRDGQRVVIMDQFEIAVGEFGLEVLRASLCPAAPEPQIGHAAGQRQAGAEASGRDRAGFDINVALPVGGQEIALGVQPEQQPPARREFGCALDPDALAGGFKRESGVVEPDRRPAALFIMEAQAGLIQHDILLLQQPGCQAAVRGGKWIIPAAPDGDPPVPPARQIKRQPAHGQAGRDRSPGRQAGQRVQGDGDPLEAAGRRAAGRIVKRDPVEEKTGRPARPLGAHSLDRERIARVVADQGLYLSLIIADTGQHEAQGRDQHGGGEHDDREAVPEQVVGENEYSFQHQGFRAKRCRIVPDCRAPPPERLSAGR